MAIRPRSFLKRFILHPLEGLAAAIFYGLFRLLPLDAASAVGGLLGRTIGPRLKVSKRARANLRRVFPDMDDAEIARIVRGMWDNLGRVVAEFPHVSSLNKPRHKDRVIVEGGEHLEPIRKGEVQGILFSGHLGNWELAVLDQALGGIRPAVFYRAPNNPFIHWILKRRTRFIHGPVFSKGSEGAKEAIRWLSQGGHLAMLVDQKMNDGIKVPFLGIDAMTAPALAQFALRYDCMVIPGWVERLHGAHFKLHVYPAIEYVKTGNTAKDVEALMSNVNAHIGMWIMQKPEQWFWLHRRWPREARKASKEN